MSPPPTTFVLFARLCPPPPAIVRPWPRQRRWCGMPALIRFEVFIVVVVVVIVIMGLDILCCGHRHLSLCAVASLVAPPPLSPRRRHYCRANACLIAPLSRQRLVVASSPLSPRQCLSRCAAASLVAPHLRRLVVASSTILTCCRLSCRAGWLLPCYLFLCAAVSLFATSLIAPPSL
jgi:hypothetical protein